MLNLLLVLTLLVVRRRHLLLVRCHFLDAHWVVAVMVVAWRAGLVQRVVDGTLPLFLLSVNWKSATCPTCSVSSGG